MSLYNRFKYWCLGLFYRKGELQYAHSGNWLTGFYINKRNNSVYIESIEFCPISEHSERIH